ncbi:hypothetical protein KAU88_00125 [Candidatus Bathyarchaeota archaeon]|nr:hypothetical protein [Candidatus Bathyarchaeota archaeon]
MEETSFEKKLLSFLPKRNTHRNDQAPVIYVPHEGYIESRKLVGDSLWLSRKMVDDGCSLEQTLQMMEERCKSCSVISLMSCVEHCETWKVKKELRETNKFLSEDNHGLKLLNAIKNKRRLAILGILHERSLVFDDLQKKLRNHGFHHSQKIIDDYLKPLFKAGLVKERNKRFGLTLYGRKIHDAMIRHCFSGQLPIHSSGYEEEILRSLLHCAKTRGGLFEGAPTKSLSRTLKRLQERELILNNSPSNRVFYFRTKRALFLERLSLTQKRICDAIPQAGIPARYLSQTVGINLRRTYKYLRSLRGKKLVFRRYVPIRYELTRKGRAIAEFLEEIAFIT